MSYARTIPRDLFNEANLLKCYGQLWIKLDDWRDHTASLDYDDGSCEPFEVVQDDDGATWLANVFLTVQGVPVGLFRPLNSRRAWPLWANAGEDDVEVFTEAGDLHADFVALITRRA